MKDLVPSTAHSEISHRRKLRGILGPNFPGFEGRLRAFLQVFPTDVAVFLRYFISEGE